MSAASMWDEFVTSAGRDVMLLVHAYGDPRVAAERPVDAVVMTGLAHVAFRVGLACLGIGAEPVARLALAAERVLDRASALDAAGRTALAEGIATLHAAFVQLANPDMSGARVEDLPLAECTGALLALDLGRVAEPAGTRPAPPPSVATAPHPLPAPGTAATVATVGYLWTPAVEEDMVELFFDEATDRLEALAGKLVAMERRPGDLDLLRDVFRDLHTVKGSSAMVGLRPINDLAHAAEDLVGQVRDAGRVADGAVVDALLAALDVLRVMLDQARARLPITADPDRVIARLRNPGAVPAMEITPIEAGTGPTAPPGVAAATAHAIEAARQTIRVDFDKLDRLLNLVGELVLGRDELRGAVSSLGAVTSELAADRGVARKVANARHAAATSPGNLGLETLGEELSRVERVLTEVTTDLDHGTDRLDAISGELREQVMRLRMVPVAGVLRKHNRTVRDLAARLGKRVKLVLVGDDTELDKLLVEALDEPLMHLVRNSVDHGVEPPDQRTAAGKPAEGTVTLSASHRGNQVEIRVSDDGRGLDPDRLRAKAVERGLMTAAEAEALDERAAREIIFRAGFSTAATVSEVSGRGVGLDVVRQTIVSRLKGTIDVESTPGQGSAFVLKLPLTLAIIQVIVARAGGETFAIPLDVVQRVFTIKRDEVELVGDREVCLVRGKHVPLIRLDAVLELDGGDDADLQLVLVDIGGRSYALACDHLLGKREIVIKSLGKLLAAVPCVAGATLLGDRVALILDIPALVARALDAPDGVPARRARKPQVSGSTQILLVEDSDTVRESLRRMLVDAGYVVTVATDGQHGLELATARRYDLVSTDVMMPRMDGYELTRALRAMPQYADIPIVMVTSMGERIDRVRGFDAGVDEYITKPHDRTQLLRAVKKLLGPAPGSAKAGEPEPPGEAT